MGPNAADARNAAQWDAVEEATERLREGDTEGASRELRAVLDRDPQNAYAHFFLGAAHFEREDFEQARVAYQHALQISPTYLGALLGLGHALRMLGKLDEAIAIGGKALAQAGDAGDPDAHYLLGLAYAARGDTRRAIDQLEKFLESNPELETRYEVDAMLQDLKGKTGPLKAV